VTSLADQRTALRVQLADVGSVEWTDAELNDAINQALKDLSRVVPRERTATIATTASSRDVTVTTGYEDLIRITAVELPTGNHPRTLRKFDFFAGILHFNDDPVPDGSSLKLFYEAYHVINGTASLPQMYDDVLLLGAAWKACAARAAGTANTVNTAGDLAPAAYAKAARAFRDEYGAAKPHPLKVRRMYAPSEPTATQDSDPGP